MEITTQWFHNPDAAGGVATKRKTAFAKVFNIGAAGSDTEVKKALLR